MLPPVSRTTTVLELFATSAEKPSNKSAFKLLTLTDDVTENGLILARDSLNVTCELKVAPLAVILAPESRETIVLGVAPVAVVCPSNKSALRLATRVLLDTVNGDVPLGTVAINRVPLTVLFETILSAVILSDTCSVFSVPT